MHLSPAKRTAADDGLGSRRSRLPHHHLARWATWRNAVPASLAAWSGRHHLRHLAAALAVAAAYYALGLLGTVLSVPPAGFAIIWPATALLIGVLLLVPPSQWWIYLSAVVSAHLAMVYRFQHQELALVVVLSQIVGNLGLAVATATAVRATFPTPLRLNSFHTVLGYILLAGLVVPAIVNALVLCLHLWSGWASEFWLSWRQWMLASVFPAVTIPPLMLTARPGTSPGKRLPRLQFSTELAIVALTSLAVSILVFGADHPSPGYEMTLRLAPLPILLWAAIRLGVAGTSLCLLIVAGAILGCAMTGRGPFAIQAPDEDVVSLQVFLITISIPLMLLAALIEERLETEEALKQSEARMRIAAAATDTGLWQYDFASGQLWATEHCRSMFGCAPGAPLTPETLLAAVIPEDRAVAGAAMRAAQLVGEAARRSEFRVLHPSGEIRWYLATGHTDFDPHGVPISLRGVFRDVTPRRKAEEEAELLSERLLTLQDEERQRIALELHDSTAQHLLAMGLNLASLKTRIAAEAAGLHLLEEIDYSLSETTKELRTFSYLLNPPQLESDGLIATLKRYAEGFSQRTGLKTSVRANPGSNHLPPVLQRSLLRIVQEALSNVHRHAAATQVTIDLRSIGKHTHLLVRDDGQGMGGHNRGTKEPIRLGVGIPGMRARLQQLGGRLEIRSGPSGTTIHAAVPVR